jgi:hypothetical protein
MQMNALQIETIIDKIVPLIAEPNDYDFFRGVLFCKAESCNSAQFSAFCAKLLKGE